MLKCQKCLRFKDPSDFYHNTSKVDLRYCTHCYTKINKLTYRNDRVEDYIYLFLGEGNWWGAYFGERYRKDAPHNK